jgi:hypothetical protein
MNNDVSAYLRELRAALRGADRATVQDALSDAEEHLTTAIDRARSEHPGKAWDELFPEIVEEFGSPEEVAMAYREIENRISPALGPVVGSAGRSAASRFFGVLTDPRAYAALIYMFLSLVTGILYFTWGVTGISVSAGLIVLIIGFPILTLFLVSVRGIALVEGRLVEAVLGVRMPRRPVFFARSAGWWRRVKMVFSDRSTWTAFLYMILLLPLGIFYFTLFTTFLAVSAALIATPILRYVFHLPIARIGLYDYYVPGWTMPLVVAAGFLLLVLTLHLAKALGGAHGKLARALLVRGDEPEQPPATG